MFAAGRRSSLFRIRAPDAAPFLLMIHERETIPGVGP
jgi:hypothetical protein